MKMKEKYNFEKNVKTEQFNMKNKDFNSAISKYSIFCLIHQNHKEKKNDRASCCPFFFFN